MQITTFSHWTQAVLKLPLMAEHTLVLYGAGCSSRWLQSISGIHCHLTWSPVSWIGSVTGLCTKGNAHFRAADRLFAKRFSVEWPAFEDWIPSLHLDVFKGYSVQLSSLTILVDYEKWPKILTVFFLLIPTSKIVSIFRITANVFS